MRALYRMLLGLYPARVRAEFAEEMLQVFESASKDARRDGVFAYSRFCLREAAGLVVSVVAEGRTMKHKKAILQGALAGLLLGLTVSIAWSTRPYTSTAVLRALPPQIPERFVPAQQMPEEVGRAVPTLIVQVITARGNLTNVINSYDLYGSERKRMPLEDIVDRMRGAIRVEPVDTDSMRVSFTYPDRFVAQKVTTDLVSRIIVEHARQRAQMAVLTAQFMKDSAEDAALEWEQTLAAARDAEASGKSLARARLDADIARQRYEALSAKLAEAEMMGDMERRQQGVTLELFDPPSLPYEARPSIPGSAVLGIIAGALLGWLISLAVSILPRRAVAAA